MSSHPACSFALGSACAQSGDAAAQCSDQRRAVRKVLLLRIQNLHEAALLQRQNRIPFAIHIELRRIANDVDQPVQCVNTSQEVIVLAIGARKKRREMRKTNAFETAATTELLECIGILRANAIDQNLIELANFTPSHDRECQNVPKWKSEVVDQNVTTRVRMPLFGINGCQQHIDVGSAGIEIDLRRQPIHQKVDALQVKSHKLAGILFEVLGISGRGREQALDQIASRGFESRRIFEAVEDAQAIVEAALQSIDDPPVETAEMRLVEDLIKSILPFDHKVQVPLAVVNVESK